jgi:hypothetical protein
LAGNLNIVFFAAMNFKKIKDNYSGNFAEIFRKSGVSFHISSTQYFPTFLLVLYIIHLIISGL